MTARRGRLGQRARTACALVAAAVLLCACGSASVAGSSTGEPSGVPAPSSGAPVPTVDAGSAPAVLSGELRTFTYLDTVADPLLGPFEAAHPDLQVRTATFDSNDEAAAKLVGGFETDVIEVCLDEKSALTDQGLLAPIDTSRLTNWDALSPAFRDAPGVTVDGQTLSVPLSAGAQGLIYVKDAFPDGVDSFSALFDPANAGRVALDGGYWLTPIAISALTLGITDPMTMTDEQVEQARDHLLASRDQFRAFAHGDADMTGLFAGGEVVLADGNRGVAAMIAEKGVDVGWAAPKEGTLSWVCGLGISTDAQNLDAAYALIDFYASAATQAELGDLGYVVTNPAAVPLVDAAHRATADPTKVGRTIAETEPANAALWRRSWQEVKAG